MRSRGLPRSIRKPPVWSRCASSVGLPTRDARASSRSRSARAIGRWWSRSPGSTGTAPRRPPAEGADRNALDIFADALELPAGERAAFLDRECAGDPVLRVELDSLLGAQARNAGGFLQQPLRVAQSAETLDDL